MFGINKGILILIIAIIIVFGLLYTFEPKNCIPIDSKEFENKKKLEYIKDKNWQQSHMRVLAQGYCEPK